MPSKVRSESFKPSTSQWWALVVVLILYGVVMGYYAGTQPVAKWRSPFSWHPFLMTLGMVTLPGIGAVTKKMGGYTNTKMHGIVSWLAILATGGGYYAIWQNKENNGSSHFTTPHAWAGLVCMVNMIGLGMVGGIVLHPDFGLDKTNKTIRTAHKLGARITLLAAWFTASLGMFTLLPADYVKLMTFVAPLICFVPYVIM